MHQSIPTIFRIQTIILKNILYKIKQSHSSIYFDYSIIYSSNDQHIIINKTKQKKIPSKALHLIFNIRQILFVMYENFTRQLFYVWYFLKSSWWCCWTVCPDLIHAPLKGVAKKFAIGTQQQNQHQLPSKEGHESQLIFKASEISK